RASFAAHGPRTRIAQLYETGGLRLRFPKAQDVCEAVAVNTAGGIVGGDRARLSFEAGAGAKVVLTTQSAEKIYRSDGAQARMDVVLRLGAGASLDWLPQEAILFDRADFSRRLEVDVAADARLTICESVVFGRLAMGEQCLNGRFRDCWRVRRAGRLVFAEDVAIEKPLALLDRPALGGGARALATLLHVAPDAQARLEDCRAALAETECAAGASAFDGILVARLASPSPDVLRAAILALFSRLLRRSPPRVWR
ncbi:MAG: urease accessory protein UreD, partial [Hyphomicrobiales bacterium]|nr:urease accessory protein UreD [Hyphomicrobiales bacterium]